MICAFEASGLLAYVCDEDEDGNRIDLPSLVLDLVDRGWVTVHRIEPWAPPGGGQGSTYSAPIPRGEIRGILADPATWEEPTGDSWVGAITLAETEAGKRVLRG
jgi:hypothetical protein